MLRCQHEIGYNPFSPNFSRLHPSFDTFTLLFSSIFIVFHHEKMGKQSSFTRQNAYDVQCTISSASHRNSTLEVDLRRTRKNVSVLASRLQEAQLIIGILEEALFSLLLPIPTLPAPPLPPRPDVVIDPPASEEDPEPLPLPVPASSPASSPLPLDPISPVPPVPPRPDVVMKPPASREDPDPTPVLTGTLRSAFRGGDFLWGPACPEAITGVLKR